MFLYNKKEINTNREGENKIIVYLNEVEKFRGNVENNNEHKEKIDKVLTVDTFTITVDLLPKKLLEYSCKHL